LIINGGSPDGNPSIPNAVSSASVSIDGRQVAGPSDFSKTTATIQKSLTLSPGRHSLDVDLNGAPDSFFRLSISGVIHLADLSQARSGHTATLLTSGKVLIAGGNGASGVLASAELFDSTSLTTTPLAVNLAAARAEHSATLMPDNATLLVGGEVLSGVL